MRKKILLVDDNEELLELLRLSFKDSGFSIVTATNGLEALKKARSLLPDLILLDLMLPEMDGFVVCETLRKDPATSAVPILILSGMSGGERASGPRSRTHTRSHADTAEKVDHSMLRLPRCADYPPGPNGPDRFFQ